MASTSRKLPLLLLSLLLLAGGSLCRAAAPAPKVVYSGPKFGNTQGEVLVVNVNHAAGAKVASTPLECQKACALTANCTAWTHCSNPKGCGQHCLDYHKQVGPEVVGNAYGCTPGFGSTWLPIQSTQNTCSGCGGRTTDKPACTPEGAWPVNTCTLLFGVDPAKAKLHPGGDAEGWVTGTIALPPGLCGDASGKTAITAYECDACSASADPAGCLKCSKAWQSTCGFARSRLLLGLLRDARVYLDSRSCLPCTQYKTAAEREKCYAQVTAPGGSSTGWPTLSEAAFKQWGYVSTGLKMWN